MLQTSSFLYSTELEEKFVLLASTKLQYAIIHGCRGIISTLQRSSIRPERVNMFSLSVQILDDNINDNLEKECK